MEIIFRKSFGVGHYVIANSRDRFRCIGVLGILLAFLLKILTIPLYLIFYDTVLLSSQALSFQCGKRWALHLAEFLLNLRFNHLNEHVYILLPTIGQKLMVPYQFIPCTVYYLIDTFGMKILRQDESLARRLFRNAAGYFSSVG